ncbi:hypothetical protein [Solibacillus sp. CAU 1738]|uniref:hypothetical protein n=1 Tax=Solibacillus sp. CAU 1738 TaxID=3140363 RepID=UPI003260D120
MSSMRDMFVGIYFQDEASKAIDKIDKKMDEAERAIIGMGNEVDLTQKSIGKMGNAGIKAGKEIGIGMKNADDGAENLQKEVKRIGDSLDGLKSKAKRMVGFIGGVFAAHKIKDFGLSAIEEAAGFQAMQAQFDQVFDNLNDSATTNLNAIAKETGIIPERLKGSFTQIAAFAKTTGVDTAAALSLTERATLAAADSAAFYDRSIENVADNLQSFLKGNFENDAALGISATETTRNTKANELYGKSFKKLSEAEKQLTLLAMVEDGNKLSGALGQAARESDAFENQLGNIKMSWTKLKAKIGGPLLQPFVGSMQSASQWIENLDTDKLIGKIDRTVEGFGAVKDTVMSLVYDTGEVSDIWQNFGLSKETSDNIADVSDMLRTTFVKGVGIAETAWGGFKEGLNWAIENKSLMISVVTGLAASFVTLKVINTVRTAMDLYKGSAIVSTIATQGFNAALRANPIGIVVTAIGLLVAGGVMLYQNWDTVTAKTNELWGAIGGLEGAMRIIFGPIGILIGAAVDLSKNWDNTKSVWGNVWSAIQRSAAESINSVIGLINEMIGVINKIPGVNIPIVAKVDWGQAEAPPSQGSTGISNADGSHATGLENVPFDGYMAELHKNEAVLTAGQSNALRRAGILRQSNGGKPEVNLPQSQSSVAVQTANPESSSTSTTNHYTISITIQAASDKAQDIKRAVKEALSDILDDDLQTI